MKRVLHVLRKLDPGGVEMWLLDIARAGGVRGFRTEVLVETRKPGRLEQQFQEAGVPAHRWTVGRFDQLRRLLTGFDAVHSHVHAFSGAILAVAASAGVPVRIAHSHTVAPPPRGARKFYWAVMRRLIERYATARLAVSRPAAANLFGNLDGVHILSCPKNLPDAAIPQTGTDALVIGHVGRIVPEKNHALLEALLAAEPAARLLLCGDGPDRPRLERQPRIQFVSSPAEVFAECSCFVFPSLREGLGLAAIEAQAAGIPCVIASNIPDEARLIPELVTVVDANATVAKWLHAVRSSASAPRLQGAADRVRRSGFTIENGLRQLEAVYAGR